MMKDYLHTTYTQLSGHLSFPEDDHWGSTVASSETNITSFCYSFSRLLQLLMRSQVRNKKYILRKHIKVSFQVATVGRLAIFGRC